MAKGPCSSCGQDLPPEDFYRHHAVRAKRCKRCESRIARIEALKRLGVVGFGLEDFFRMLKEQDSRCVICHDILNLENGQTHIDHCHKTLKVRGILCGHCNNVIGRSRENITVLLNAIEYLRRFE